MPKLKGLVRQRSHHGELERHHNCKHTYLFCADVRNLRRSARKRSKITTKADAQMLLIAPRPCLQASNWLTKQLKAHLAANCFFRPSLHLLPWRRPLTTVAVWPERRCEAAADAAVISGVISGVMSVNVSTGTFRDLCV